MDERIHQVGTVASILVAVAGLGVGVKDYLVNAQTTPVSQSPRIPKSGEFTPIVLKDGSSWALVKIWKPAQEGQPGGLERFNPAIPPDPSLRIITQGIEQGVTGFVAEMGDSNGGSVYGWAFILKDPNQCKDFPKGVCDLSLKDFKWIPVSQEFANQNKELFKILQNNKTN